MADHPGRKAALLFHCARRLAGLSVAGLWDEWRNTETGEALKSCAMIITNSNDFVGEVHDRMPVLLNPDQFSPWLTGQGGKRC
jgi:putative SOS response-associated peptidase YedK